MNDETTKDEIRDFVKSWLAGFNSKNREDFFPLFHPEAIYANDGSPLMRGPSEIRPWYEQAFETIAARVLFKEEAIVAEGNMAFVVGKFYMEPTDGEEGSGESGRVAMVLRRNPRGKWLLALDMDNRPPDSVPADFASANKIDAYLPA